MALCPVPARRRIMGHLGYPTISSLRLFRVRHGRMGRLPLLADSSNGYCGVRVTTSLLRLGLSTLPVTEATDALQPATEQPSGRSPGETTSWRFQLLPAASSPVKKT